MNKKCLIVVMLNALFMTNIMAQQLKTPTLDNLIPGGETFLYPKNLYNLNWWGNECIKPSIDKLTAVDPVTGKESILATRADVNKTLEAKQYGKIEHFYRVTLPWAEKSWMVIPVKDRYIVYDFKKNEIVNAISFNEKGENMDFNTINGKVAYTVGNNLYVDSKAITNEPDGIVCGKSVHRNEFGIKDGIFWSPKGSLLAFYKMDESMVAQYPLVDISQRIGKLEYIHYPMAGMTSHKVYVGIYNPATEKTIYLNTGDPTDRYFTNISWSPDEKKIYLIELNRDQNHSKLCRYDATTGNLEAILIEETDSKYVEPMNPITFLPWNSNQFIYQSQRDGFNHLYLYNTDGKLIKQLTKGNWLVQEMLGFRLKEKEIVFTSTANSPLQTNLFRVNMNGKITAIGNSEGKHNCTLNPSGEYVIDNYSTPQIPRNIDLLSIQKGSSKRILTADNPLNGYKMPVIKTGTIKAADGVTDLYYRLVVPSDLDPTKKYPAIVYVYGGPHAQMVDNSWHNSARGWDIYMANKGYIMFTLDNRGSENRGKAFEQVTFRQLGIEEGKDQLKGIDFLKSLGYVDQNRIGVHGWSFGGHMTVALMLRYPEVFKVGVAGGPVIDWSYYEVMYGERYMDTPQTNPEGYKGSNLKNLAGNLKGHLMLIHDDQDHTCVMQHSLSFLKACIEAKTYPDFFIYPGHDHNVAGYERVHLHEKITRYFEEHL